MSQRAYVDKLTQLGCAKGRARWFCMLRAAMDESGIQEAAPVCIVAGYVASASKWRTFEKEWKRVLRKHGVAEFHAKRFFGLDNKWQRLDEYAGWSQDKADAFRESLLLAIKRGGLYALGSAISVELFNCYNEDERRYLTGGEFSGGKWIRSGSPNKPYYLPFQSCVFGAAERCKVGEKVDFVFDQNKQLSPWALEVYKELKLFTKKVKENLGAIAFEDSQTEVGLQAADLICYEMYQLLKHNPLQHRLKPSYILREAIKRGGKAHTFTQELIERLLRGLPAKLRSSFATRGLED